MKEEINKECLAVFKKIDTRLGKIEKNLDHHQDLLLDIHRMVTYMFENWAGMGDIKEFKKKQVTGSGSCGRSRPPMAAKPR